MSTLKQVLITGAGGYLGSLLTPLLLERGYHVTAFDAFYFGMHVLDRIANHPNLRIIRGDIRYLDSSLLYNTKAVIHLASLSNDSSCELDQFTTVNINLDAAVHLAHLSKKLGVERFLFASSCSVYGFSGEELLNEGSRIHPISLYAQTKARAEEAILQRADNSFHSIALRMATLYGLSNRMRFDLVLNAMTLDAVLKGQVSVFGGGRQWRPLLHVRDAANAFLLCLEAPGEKMSGRAFNVMNQNIQMIDLASIISQRVSNAIVHVEQDTNERRNYRVSDQLFRHEMGFSPLFSVESGVDEIAMAIRNGTLKDLNDPRYYTVQVLKRFFANAK